MPKPKRWSAIAVAGLLAGCQGIGVDAPDVAAVPAAPLIEPAAGPPLPPPVASISEYAFGPDAVAFRPAVAAAMPTRSVQFEPAAATAPAGVTAAAVTGAAAATPAPRAANVQSWFSFVAGDDIRAECTDEATVHYRFIFNANFEEQVRIYDMRGAEDDSAVLTKTIRGPATVQDAEALTSRLGGTRFLNALGPYEQKILLESLEESGFHGDPIPAGTVLQSDAFYWAVAACDDGEFHFNAWVYPSERWDEATFPYMLGQLDFSGIMYNKERVADPVQQQARRNGDGVSTVFDLAVDSDGNLNTTCRVC
jgi:hypothetical protein